MDAELVTAVLEDWRSAPVNDRMRGALQFVEKLTLYPKQLDESDVERARISGLSDTALHELAYVTCLFSVMDRLADAFDFTIPTDAQVTETGKFLNKHGYKLAKLIR